MLLQKKDNDFSLSQKWDFTQIDFNNPTNSDITIDIFNAITISNFSSKSTNSLFPNTINFSSSVAAKLNYPVFCPVNQFAYVSDLGSNNILVFDTITNTFVTVITLPKTVLNQMAYCSVSNKIYASSSTGGSLQVIDCATNTYLTTLSFGGVDSVLSIEYSVVNNSIYTTQPTSSLVQRIDCTTDLVVDIYFQAGLKPTAVKYNPINNFIYVFGSNGTIIELTSIGLLLNSTTPIPDILIEYGAVAFVFSNNSIYYQENTTFAIRKFDCSSLSLTASIPSTYTVSIIYNSISNVLYLSNNNTVTDTVDVISPVSDSLIVSIPTPTTNYGTKAYLLFQSIKNSIYEFSFFSGITGIFELAVDSVFNIVSPYNYNALLQDIQTNPMLVRRIMIIADSQSQFAQPLSMLTRNANGNQAVIPKLPNISLSVNQVQSNIATIDFKLMELVLDDNTMFSQYTFPKNTKTRFIVYYKQINRIDLLSSKINNCDALEKYLNFKEVSVTEAELQEVSSEPILLENIKKEEKQQKRLATKMKMMDRFKKR